MNTNPYKILVVDDEQDILELLSYNLEKEGYDVQTVNNGLDAISIAKDFVPDLIIMDIMMPKMDGVETGQRLRALPETAESYLVYLTARVEEYSEIAAFNVGADDYIVKPIKPKALLGRIAAMFRREQRRTVQESKINLNGLMIDKSSYTVEYKDRVMNLPKKEFELLYFFAQNPNKVFTRDDLLRHVWGTDIYVLARTVDVHVRKVREKIGDDFIQTIKGVGYKFIFAS
jgi:two-component system, OmpR family, alkaline phosphatase synthesis response regulator PhoP